MEHYNGFVCGERVCLRPIADDDTGLIVKWRNDPYVKSFLLGQEDITPEDHLNWMNSRVRTGECLQFIIMEPGAGACGTVMLKNIGRKEGEAEFGIFIGEPSGRGRGIGKEATALMIGHAFGKLGLSALWLEVLETNPAAIHIYKSLGFKELEELSGQVERGGRNVRLLHMRAERDGYRKACAGS